MKLLRNREIIRELALSAAFTVLPAAACLAGYIPGPLAVLAAGAACALIHIIFLRSRYRAISELSSAIDRILHGQQEVLISKNSEGELSVLCSEIEKMTLRLKESSDALAADKLLLTDAIADISHQLRTPLTSMNLTVSMLAQEDLSKSRRLEMTRELRRMLMRIDWLIEALLKISRIDAGAVEFKREPVRVQMLIQKSIQPLAIAMELKEIEAHISAGDESFTGDMAWTAEALTNIIKNCVEHTPPGGRIAICADETPLFTEIIVQDNGSGFDPDDLPHLFERFYKGKSADQDSIGIGLALARMVVVRQNGTVSAANAGGARFRIRFYKGII